MTERRPPRGQLTRTALMRAAERLIADQGIENVSIRDIVSSAGQKNESALQYHFGNLQGLLKALHASRDEEIQARRSILLQQLLDEAPKPTLRQICEVMVKPSFELARARPDYRRYVKAFGQEITLTDESALSKVNRGGGESAKQVGILLRAALPHLDAAAYQRRMDGALRFVSAAMVHQARQKNAFRGIQAELFFSSLIDALVGLLSAPESAQTTAIYRSMNHTPNTKE